MNNRLRLLYYTSIILTSLWLVHLFIVQVIDPNNLERRRDIRYKPIKDIIIPKRGNIYDANGVLLVSSVSYYQIDLDKKAIQNLCIRKKKDYRPILRNACTIIANSTNKDPESLYEKVLARKTNTVLISLKVKESQLAKIKDEFSKNHIPGLITAFNSQKRIYSKGKIAARLLGMVKEETNEETDSKARSIYKMEGYCGLEATLNDILRGDYGWKETFFDAHNKIVDFPNLKEKKPNNGNSVYLTIDTTIQEILENNLSNGLDRTHAKNAIGIIMNPNTGEIIAMAGISSTDQSKDIQEVRALPNLPVSFQFEPGSTFKPFVALLALEKKIFKPTDRINCQTYLVGKRKISDSHHYSTLNFRDIIAYSSNVGISKIVDRVGARPVYDRYISLGFGHKSGMNMYGESAGILRNLSEWSGYTLHSISFGQEVAVNALQLTNAYCAIANGGKLMKPVIIKEVRDDEGKVIHTMDPQVIRIISDRKSTDTLKVFLKNVVDYGTAKNIKLDYVTIAGKTGTAEKKVQGVMGYSKYQYTAVFTGFFPTDNPKYVMSIIYDEPDYAYHFGSMSAAPTFRHIVEEIVALPTCQIIPETKNEDQNLISMPDVMGLPAVSGELKLRNLGIRFNKVVKDSGGYIINQYPKANVSFAKSNIITIIIGSKRTVTQRENPDAIMPNLVGMTLRKAVSLAKIKRISLEVQGFGIITSQEIPPGSRLHYNQSCKVVAK